MPRVPVGDGVSLYCQDLGSGPAIMLVHGGCMSHRVWESQVHSLLEAGYRVVTPDLRGHGDSDKPASPYTAEMYADDLAVVANRLGIDSFSLLGWSLGSTITSAFASAYGDRLDGLVLVSSAIFARIGAVARDERVSVDLPVERMIENQRYNRPEGLERFVTGMFHETPDKWTRHWLWTIAMQTPMRVALKTLRIYVDPEQRTLHEGLATIDAPAAVFYGENDRSSSVSDARTIAEDVFSDGRYVPFEHSAHVPFIEQPQRFDNELVDFLESVHNSA
ncbi:alpha/beta fold hydrolase [Halorientalis sp.]|uniref:alpha/beta fold hydrolase n=1 Tax=Halorientalis sp. TaxID=1931229 RepID=UPI00261278D1|nr:alpha/beta hydrolase [Halorientalis sp.]